MSIFLIFRLGSNTIVSNSRTTSLAARVYHHLLFLRSYHGSNSILIDAIQPRIRMQYFVDKHFW